MKRVIAIIFVSSLVFACATSKVIISYDLQDEGNPSRARKAESSTMEESADFKLKGGWELPQIKNLPTIPSNERILIEVDGKYYPDARGNTEIFLPSIDPVDPILLKIYVKKPNPSLQIKVDMFLVYLTIGSEYVKIDYDRLPETLENAYYEIEMRIISKTPDNLNDKQVKEEILLVTSECNQDECTNTEMRNFTLNMIIHYQKPFIVAPREIIFNVPYGKSEWKRISICNTGVQQAVVDLNLLSLPFQQGAFKLNPSDLKDINIFSNQCIPLEVGFSANKNGSSKGLIIIKEKNTRRYFILLQGNSL